MKWCNQQIGAHVRGSDVAKRAAKITGIGEIGAWLGIVPSQNASGGKASLGRITKRGDDYLRTLLIQGAKSALMSERGQTRRPDIALAAATGGPA